MSSAASAASQRLGQRLHRLSTLVRGLVLLSTPLLLALPLAFLTLPDNLLREWLDQPAGLNLLPLMKAGLTDAARRHVALASLPPIAIGLALLWQLWRLFGEYRHGRLFSPQAVGSLGRFGWLLLISALASPLFGAALTVAASWDNPPGERMVMLSVSSDEWFRGLLALVFVALAKVMQEAARVAEENDGFV